MVGSFTYKLWSWALLGCNPRTILCLDAMLWGRNLIPLCLLNMEWPLEPVGRKTTQNIRLLCSVRVEGCEAAIFWHETEHSSCFLALRWAFVYLFCRASRLQLQILLIGYLGKRITVYKTQPRAKIFIFLTFVLLLPAEASKCQSRLSAPAGKVNPKHPNVTVSNARSN